MGVIEDGTVTGRLPSAEVFAVHYPIYFTSMSSAIETLGGSDAIAKARTSKVNQLELHFRPGDPLSHPKFGHLHPSNSLLLRISRKNGGVTQIDNCSGCQSKSNLENTEKQAPASTSNVDLLLQENSIVLSAEIVACVREAYHFTGMADYQHVLAVHADVARRKRRWWSEVKGPFEKDDLGDADYGNLVIIVPPLFTMKDVPENIALRPSILLSSKKKLEGVVQDRWELKIEPCLAIDFSIKEIPRKVNWEEHILQESDKWKWHMAVSSLFDERPIWPKSSIAERLDNMGLKIGDHMLRRILFRTAYYFGSGPFHRFYIKKGYDPRKDPESRLYQRIDFRVPPPLRGYCDGASGMKHKWEDMCTFRVFPNKCQTYFQLFELADDYIQQEIRKPPNYTVCTCSTGWFSSYALDSLRLRVAVRFLSVYPQVGAESLLKSVTERFEKSKKMRFRVSNLKPGEEGESQVNQELTGKEDKDSDGDGDDDDDDDDDEDDDDEENEIEDEGELELEDDHPYMGEEDTDFALQSDSYFGRENFSREYLQELFERFPPIEDAFTQLHDEDSDGVYHTYEQDSDDNYSDDDPY